MLNDSCYQNIVLLPEIEITCLELASKAYYKIIANNEFINTFKSHIYKTFKSQDTHGD